MLGTIEQELVACRAAFEGVAVGALVWCCHHDRLLEPLTEPAADRIDYIISYKPAGEWVRRLHEFRPVRGELPAEWSKADAGWRKAAAEWSKADAGWRKADAERSKAAAEWSKAAAEWSKADAERSKADAERRKADAEWSKAAAEWSKADADPAIIAPHLSEVPDTAWNGRSIFPE